MICQQFNSNQTWVSIWGTICVRQSAIVEPFTLHALSVSVCVCECECVSSHTTSIEYNTNGKRFKWWQAHRSILREVISTGAEAHKSHSSTMAARGYVNADGTERHDETNRLNHSINTLQQQRQQRATKWKTGINDIVMCNK